MKIYLITHAHTEQLPNVAGDTWHLSARGVGEARELAACDLWHSVDRVVVSAEPKTWLTVAEIVVARNLPVWIDCRFDELRRAGWIQDYAAQVAAVFAEPHTSVGGWETVERVQRRVLMALDDLPRRFPGETLAVVGHGLCLSILRAAIRGDACVDFDTWQRLPFAAHAAISTSPRAMVEDFALNAQEAR